MNKRRLIAVAEAQVRNVDAVVKQRDAQLFPGRALRDA
jgi:hypothetical protein